jgi:hypothetical protein
VTEPRTSGSADPSSAGALVHRLTEQLSRLARDELKLAEAELGRKAGLMAKGAGIFGGSGVLAVFGTGCLLAAGVAGIATVLPVWLAALIVGVFLFACAGLAALLGKREVSHATPVVPEQTMQNLQADVQAITERARP